MATATKQFPFSRYHCWNQKPPKALVPNFVKGVVGTFRVDVYLFSERLKPKNSRTQTAAAKVPWCRDVRLVRAIGLSQLCSGPHAVRESSGIWRSGVYEALGVGGSSIRVYSVMQGMFLYIHIYIYIYM